MRGAVVCSNQIAAEVGADIIRLGGNAVDSAIATALSLCVVDPANCGVGGYGGYMVVQDGQGQSPKVVDFNAQVPKNFKSTLLTSNNHISNSIGGASSVSMPMVLSGLKRAHEEFGSMPFKELCSKPIEIARDGFVIGENLNMALRWAEGRDSEFSESFKSIFAPRGKWLALGDVLVQSDLSKTLEKIQIQLDEYFYTGEFALQTSKYIEQQGGWLELEHFNSFASKTYSAHQFSFDEYYIYGPPPITSGYGVVCDALDFLSKDDDLFENEDSYIFKVSESLRYGWEKKKSIFATASNEVTQHTTHFCVTDLSGMMVSCTFTHGPLWFGSGMITPGTGVVLNCAANLFRKELTSGQWLCVTNLSPNIMHGKEGSRLASGAPGGSRIPAIALQIILEMTKGGGDLRKAINKKRVSVSPIGELELEDMNLAKMHHAHRIFEEEYFGPSSAILRKGNGDIYVGIDDRFKSGVAVI
jgi:gamma-glutamyltranspeptidase/glutathione hydrolase